MGNKSMKSVASKAKKASFALSVLSGSKRNQIIRQMAKNLLQDKNLLMSANKKDLAVGARMGLNKALIGRLELSEKKIKAMAKGLKEIATLPDPLHQVLETTTRPNGLTIYKESVPLGVILIIFESRPNVTADCAGLCLKSGNSVILRGGKEAFFSNQAIHASLVRALRKNKVPQEAVSFIQTTDRACVGELLNCDDSIDVVIPRGGESLIRRVATASKIPVLKHYKGICHTYIDKYADLNRAIQIAINAKIQNPGVCNAMETLLVHKTVANKFLPAFCLKAKEHGLEMRGCSKTKKILKNIKLAKNIDWDTEYLDMILSIRVVDSIDESIEHIRVHGSSHSDAIVSKSKKSLKQFVSGVGSACVFENASTRFSDGGEFGMGAEMGISTDKLHARGPVGLKELTTYHYRVVGTGQIRT